MERVSFLPPSDFVVSTLASLSPVVIFGKTKCCVCHTIKTFQEFKVRPAAHDLDQEPKGREMERVVRTMGCKPAVPALFIGGALIGGANEIMSIHLSGSLVPLLRRAGAM